MYFSSITKRLQHIIVKTMLLLHLPVKRNDLNSWVAGLAGNTALVSTASHLDVSGITPASSPGVLDDPVGTIVGISTVSDGQNSVVDGLGAARVDVHTRAVELESLSGSVEGDRYWADGSDSVQQVVLIITSDANVAGAGGSSVSAAVTTASISAFIRIAGFGIDSAVVLDVVVSPLDDAAVASVVSVAGTAVDQILFAEGNQLAGFTEILSFQSTSGRERPAASALSLIFNTGDESLVAPIDTGWGFEVGGSHEQWSFLGELLGFVGLHSFEFFGEHITELVHFHAVGDFSLFEAGVVGGDHVAVLQIDRHAEFFFGGCVGLAMSDLEEAPLLVKSVLNGKTA